MFALTVILADGVEAGAIRYDACIGTWRRQDLAGQKVEFTCNSR